MDIELIFEHKFVKASKKLPTAQQKKLAILLETFVKNPFSPLLHSKSLTGSLAGLHSFRINREWRVVFQFINPNTIQLIEVAHRKDIYR